VGAVEQADQLAALGFLAEAEDVAGAVVREYIKEERLMQSSLYQEILAKGEDKGLQRGMEALRQAAIELCEQRFGHDEQGLERIRGIKEPGALSRLIVRLGTASSLSEALSTLPSI
jgi:predicted transposase YdaD